MLYCGSALSTLPLTGLVCIEEQPGYLLSYNLPSSGGDTLAMNQVKIKQRIRLIQTMASTR